MFYFSKCVQVLSEDDEREFHAVCSSETTDSWYLVGAVWSVTKPRSMQFAQLFEFEYYFEILF